jgi:AcrR family transcriptional regulator
MYTGKNPTALRSQALIADAAAGLLKTKGYDRLSVKEICAAADLSRQTFYEFFDSKEAAVRFSIRQKLVAIPESISPPDRRSIESYFYTHIAGNKAFLKLLAKNHLGGLLGEEISGSLSELARQLNPGADEGSRKIANAYLTSALTSSFLVWAGGDVKITEQDFISLLYQIMRGRFFKIN